MDDGTRLKRLRIRAARRGIRELDLLLGAFAEGQSAWTPQLELFEQMLSESDNDIYDWFVERVSPPERYRDLLLSIRRFHRIEE